MGHEAARALRGAGTQEDRTLRMLSKPSDDGWPNQTGEGGAGTAREPVTGIVDAV